MPELRTSTALRQLADLDDVPDPPSWSWAVVTLEPSGRVRLPSAACAALGVRAEVWALCHREALVLRSDGDGRRMRLDCRGRLYVPAWLRRGRDTSLLVGTRHTDRIVVLITPTVLDRVGDVLIGAGR